MNWAGDAGFEVDIVSQYDLQLRPEVLEGYPCVVFIGHDEYWSWEMRDTVDAYVEAGGRIARFAGNFMWQTRLEDNGRRQVCYKSRARTEDPQRDTNRILDEVKAQALPGGGGEERTRVWNERFYWLAGLALLLLLPLFRRALPDYQTRAQLVSWHR